MLNYMSCESALSNLENLHVLTRVLCRRPVATTVGTEVAVNMLGDPRCSFANTQD